MRADAAPTPDRVATGAQNRRVGADAAERATRATLLALSQRASIGRLATRVPLTRPLVRRFVAGETLDEALTVLRQLQARGLSTTVDVLGESVTQPADARAAADRYLRLLDALAAHHLDRNVSLKASQMGLGIDPTLARQLVGEIVDRAVQLVAFVRIDMEGHTTTDATLDLWRAVRPTVVERGADVGIVIQAALRRSATDLDAIIEAGGRVRLCKGAYREPAGVAWQDKAEVDAAYEALMLRLLRDGHDAAIATHDVRLIRRAIEVSTAEGIRPDTFEFQMLYGIRRDLQEELAGAGWRVRTYVPFGAQWYPYFMRRLAERPANVTFLLRNLWREGGRG